MKTEELDYILPKELIAQEPVSPRDAAKLLVLDKEKGTLVDSAFKDIGDYLKAGDVLVLIKQKSSRPGCLRPKRAVEKLK